MEEHRDHQVYGKEQREEDMKITKGPVALVVLALAAEMAYIFIKGSKEVAVDKLRKDSRDRSDRK